MEGYKAGNQLVTHLYKPTLYVFSQLEGEIGYGIKCECPWEPEHQCLILLMFVKQIFEDFENLENKKESNLNKTCCCRPAVNSYNESGQIYLYNSIARA